MMVHAASSPDVADHSLPPWGTQEPSEAVTEALNALQLYKKKDAEKGKLSALGCFQTSHSFSVIVRFKAVGNAPIMKQNFFKITSSNKFQAVIQFLRKELKWNTGDPLVRKFVELI